MSMIETLRLSVAEHIAKKTPSVSVELFFSKKIVVGVGGGTEHIIHPTKITFEKFH